MTGFGARWLSWVSDRRRSALRKLMILTYCMRTVDREALGFRVHGFPGTAVFESTLNCIARSCITALHLWRFSFEVLATDIVNRYLQEIYSSKGCPSQPKLFCAAEIGLISKVFDASICTSLAIVELAFWTGIGGRTYVFAQTVTSGQTTLLLHPVADPIMALFIRLTSP